MSRLASTEEEDNQSDFVKVGLPVVKALCTFVEYQQPFAFQCQAHVADGGNPDSSDIMGQSSLEVLDVKKLQKDDEAISFIFPFVKNKQKPTSRDVKGKPKRAQLMAWQWQKLRIVEGILYRQRQTDEGTKLQLVLPEQCQDLVLTSMHDEMGHQGRDRTLDLVRSRFYWPGMSVAVGQKVSNCDRCIRRKNITTDCASLISIESCEPLQLVCIDYLSLEPSQGYDSVLIITDHFSKYAQAIPTRNQTAKTTARLLYDNFILHYGIPDRLHSDNGRSFENKIIEELCAIMGIEKSHTTPYHPESNGIAERFNRSLLSMLGTLPVDKKSAWKEHIASVVHAYNSTRHATTGYSPYQLMFGREAKLPIDVMFGLSTADDNSKTYTEYVRKLRKKIEHGFELARKNTTESQKGQAEIHDKKVRGVTLQVGDLVLVRNKHVHRCDKLADYWEPDVYKVLAKPYPQLPVYVVKPQKGGRKRTLHRNLLVPYLVAPPTKRDDTSAEVESDSEDEETGFLAVSQQPAYNAPDISAGSTLPSSNTDTDMPTSMSVNSDTQEIDLDADDSMTLDEPVVSHDHDVNTIDVLHGDTDASQPDAEASTADQDMGTSGNVPVVEQQGTQEMDTSFGSQDADMSGAPQEHTSSETETDAGTVTDDHDGSEPVNSQHIPVEPDTAASVQDTEDVPEEETSETDVSEQPQPPIAPEPKTTKRHAKQVPPTGALRRSTRTCKPPDRLVAGQYQAKHVTVESDMSESPLDSKSEWKQKAELFEKMIAANPQLLSNPQVLQSFLDLTRV